MGGRMVGPLRGWHQDMCCVRNAAQHDGAGARCGGVYSSGLCARRQRSRQSKCCKRRLWTCDPLLPWARGEAQQPQRVAHAWRLRKTRLCHEDLCLPRRAQRSRIKSCLCPVGCQLGACVTRNSNAQQEEAVRSLRTQQSPQVHRAPANRQGAAIAGCSKPGRPRATPSCALKSGRKNGLRAMANRTQALAGHMINRSSRPLPASPV
jgi:hypothetical protein